MAGFRDLLALTLRWWSSSVTVETGAIDGRIQVVASVQGRNQIRPSVEGTVDVVGSVAGRVEVEP